MRWSRNFFINSLRVSWIICILLVEFAPFKYSAAQCRWPDHISPNSKQRPHHVLLVADPQIPNRHSYPERSALLSWLTSIFVDLNLRRSWRMVALRMQPDAVIFLGDMMDSGRIRMEYSEWYWYLVRFKKIFSMDKTLERHYIPGNHDIGLGTSKEYGMNLLANGWYKNHFGAANKWTIIGDHTFVFLDAPTLVHEDLMRIESAKRTPVQDWGEPGGSFDFIRRYAQDRGDGPVVLLTHIPLHRPDGAVCGPYREKGSIQPGVGLGYSNTLSKDVSDFVLESIKPSIIFSGDDHDFCEYWHSLTTRQFHIKVREVTVKSMSMVMNVRRPAIHLLSLNTTDEKTRNKKGTFADKMCLLPNQLLVYLLGYVPFLVCSLAVVVLQHTSAPRPRRLSGSRLPPPGSHKASGARVRNWCSRTVIQGVLRDVRDVAVFPVALFLVLTFISLTS